MHLLKFIPIKLTLCLILGILIGQYFAFDMYIPLIGLVLLLTVLGGIFAKGSPRNSIRFGVVALLSCVVLGVLAVSLWLPKNQADHYSHQDKGKEHLWKIKIVDVLKPNAFSNRYIGRLVLRNGKPVSGKVILNSGHDTLAVKYHIDDELYYYGSFATIKPPLNAHGFDYRKYLSHLGIYHQIWISDNNHLNGSSASKTIYGRAASLRDRIVNKLQKARFGQDQLGIVQALLLGQRNDIAAETYTHYKNAGAVHLLAVSGLHIGILLMLLQFILRPLHHLPKGKGISLVLTVILLWSFALLTGFSASVVRSVTMFSFVAYALYLNRPSNTFNILALSMFAILLIINPMFLFQVGFQLSYAAVIAIVWIYPMLLRFWSPKHVLVKKIWQLMAVSIAAQLGVLPLSLFYFHQFPALFFVTNLLIVPAMGAILGMGIITCVLALLDSLPEWFAAIYNELIGLMNATIEIIARQEAFVFTNISFDSVQLVLSYGAIVSFLLLCSKVRFKRLIVALGWVLCFQVWTFYTLFAAGNKEALVVAHRNKGTLVLHQLGHALKIHTPDSALTHAVTSYYKRAERTKHIEVRPLQNSYQWGPKKILVVDSLGLYTAAHVDCVILVQSPKINLERLIDSVRPNRIIADGSNFRSYVTRWKQTCNQRKLSFHYTGEKGAFYFD